MAHVTGRRARFDLNTTSNALGASRCAGGAVFSGLAALTGRRAGSSLVRTRAAARALNRALCSKRPDPATSTGRSASGGLESSLRAAGASTRLGTRVKASGACSAAHCRVKTAVVPAERTTLTFCALAVSVEDASQRLAFGFRVQSKAAIRARVAGSFESACTAIQASSCARRSLVGSRSTAITRSSPGFCCSGTGWAQLAQSRTGGLVLHRGELACTAVRARGLPGAALELTSGARGAHGNSSGGKCSGDATHALPVSCLVGTRRADSAKAGAGSRNSRV